MTWSVRTGKLDLELAAGIPNSNARWFVDVYCYSHSVSQVSPKLQLLVASNTRWGPDRDGGEGRVVWAARINPGSVQPLKLVVVDVTPAGWTASSEAA
jgi:hypothetical protein